MAKEYDVVTIGSGPAGLAAALELERAGVRHVVIERESRPGGILKQCIHDGFGLHRFKERLTGPEYAERFIKEANEKNIEILNNTFVTKIEKNTQGFSLSLVNSTCGVFHIQVKAIILANGCRERTNKQINIHGTRPSGIYTAGAAQYMINMQGWMPCKKCIVLGSGDIGLIMARRLTLEGAEVLGVYEAKDSPSGLTRNVSQCLNDFDIPLHLSKTVTEVYGQDKLEGVKIQSVDSSMRPITGTEEYIACDCLILSVGLIPENELASALNVTLDDHTKGPVVDQNMMSMTDGLFSCGNALHVNDLVDYVSESGETAAKCAAKYAQQADRQRKLIDICYRDKDLLYVVPQKIDLSDAGETSLYFRSKDVLHNKVLKIYQDGAVLYKKRYETLKPPEMERIALNLDKLLKSNQCSTLNILLEDDHD